MREETWVEGTSSRGALACSGEQWVRRLGKRIMTALGVFIYLRGMGAGRKWRPEPAPVYKGMVYVLKEGQILASASFGLRRWVQKSALKGPGEEIS